METKYEWDIETIETKHGDVVDHYHHDKLSDLLDTLKQWAPKSGERYEVVLVRDVGSNDEGVVDRQWWYPGFYMTHEAETPRFGEGYGGTPVTKKHLAEYARHEVELRKALDCLHPN
jgi:hypothetical protein